MLNGCELNTIIIYIDPGYVIGYETRVFDAFSACRWASPRRVVAPSNVLIEHVESVSQMSALDPTCLYAISYFTCFTDFAVFVASMRLPGCQYG